MKVGTKAPEFTLQDGDGNTVRLSSFQGRKVVVYFYPKDLTPGCTTEACDFRDLHPRFAKSNVAVLGISPDPIDRHQTFTAKYELNFPLLADTDHAVAEAYGVWTEKQLYGRKFMGIERTTFLIDEQGRIEKIWRKVKVKGHAKEVLAAAGVSGASGRLPASSGRLAATSGRAKAATSGRAKAATSGRVGATSSRAAKGSARVAATSARGKAANGAAGGGKKKAAKKAPAAKAAKGAAPGKKAASKKAARAKR